ncbi:hypothetical protein BCR44DRAFT_1441256 [Catenaria anguillulae PL171]|uniref:Uncharacterized protein n=1 Tax=Catenaria anguillulae PL171 TaxID=765915 RepID=A0A1Y2HEB4_9FUNG|nr:hypothetical protein BCR44DRAFT_1441256 [Catenaria anguillulae PL171]
MHWTIHESSRLCPQYTLRPLISPGMRLAANPRYLYSRPLAIRGRPNQTKSSDPGHTHACDTLFDH